MSEEIVNRVAQSGILNLDPADYYPKFEIIELDIKPWLFQGLLLKEKDFRDHLAAHDWSQYGNSHVAIFCSSDAIIPQWAFMLLASYLLPYTKYFYAGSRQDIVKAHMLENIEKADFSQFEKGRVIIKGCGDHPIPEAAYLELTKKLMPLALSVMFGEACSTVPIYKKKK